MRPVQVDSAAGLDTEQVEGPAERRLAVALLRATRPRQWIKNVLVFAAPAAAGVLGREGPFLRALAAFWIFVAASAATYLLNDVLDRERDRLHPVKRSRPIASGLVSGRLAIGLSIGLTVASLAGAAAVSTALLIVVAAYLAISTAYSVGLKRAPGVELVCVAAGFVLRAVGGGSATGVYISGWFLIMTAFGALLIVAGKRSVEQRVMGEEGAAHRSALALYPPWLLKGLRLLAISVTVATYCLWTFERAAGLSLRDRHDDMIWFDLSIVPFVLAVLLVELAIERGRGGEPEELALTNHVLQLLGAVWLTLLLLGVYG